MKEKVIHTIKIKFCTTSRLTTETIIEKVYDLIAQDRNFTQKFEYIEVTGKNNS